MENNSIWIIDDDIDDQELIQESDQQISQAYRLRAHGFFIKEAEFEEPMSTH
jgi:hypothetical protein